MAEETPFLNFYGGEFDPESGRFRDPSGKFVPTPPKEESENVGEKAKSEKDKKNVVKNLEETKDNTLKTNQILMDFMGDGSDGSGSKPSAGGGGGSKPSTGGGGTSPKPSGKGERKAPPQKSEEELAEEERLFDKFSDMTDEDLEAMIKKDAEEQARKKAKEDELNNASFLRRFGAEVFSDIKGSVVGVLSSLPLSGAFKRALGRNQKAKQQQIKDAEKEIRRRRGNAEAQEGLPDDFRDAPDVGEILAGEDSNDDVGISSTMDSDDDGVPDASEAISTEHGNFLSQLININQDGFSRLISLTEMIKADLETLVQDSLDSKLENREKRSERLKTKLKAPSKKSDDDSSGGDDDGGGGILDAVAGLAGDALYASALRGPRTTNRTPNRGPNRRPNRGPRGRSRLARTANRLKALMGMNTRVTTPSGVRFRNPSTGQFTQASRLNRASSALRNTAAGRGVANVTNTVRNTTSTATTAIRNSAVARNATRATNAVKNQVSKATGAARNLATTAASTKVGQAVTSRASTIAASKGGRAALTAARVGGSAAGKAIPIVGAVMGGAIESQITYDDSYYRAINQGYSPEEADRMAQSDANIAKGLGALDSFNPVTLAGHLMTLAGEDTMVGQAGQAIIDNIGVQEQVKGFKAAGDSETYRALAAGVGLVSSSSELTKEKYDAMLENAKGNKDAFKKMVSDAGGYEPGARFLYYMKLEELARQAAMSGMEEFPYQDFMSGRDPILLSPVDAAEKADEGMNSASSVIDFDLQDPEGEFYAQAYKFVNGSSFEGETTQPNIDPVSTAPTSQIDSVTRGIPAGLSRPVGDPMEMGTSEMKLSERSANNPNMREMTISKVKHESRMDYAEKHGLDPSNLPAGLKTDVDIIENPDGTATIRARTDKINLQALSPNGSLSANIDDSLSLGMVSDGANMRTSQVEMASSMSGGGPASNNIVAPTTNSVVNNSDVQVAMGGDSFFNDPIFMMNHFNVKSQSEIFST